MPLQAQQQTAVPMATNLIAGCADKASLKRLQDALAMEARRGRWSLLHEIIFASWFEPQGPLRWRDHAKNISSILISIEEATQPKIRLIETTLSPHLPKPLPAGFENWSPPRLSAEASHVIQENGGETAEVINKLLAEGRFRVTVKTKLDPSSKSGFKFSLAVPTVAKSCRFSRKFGSDRILRLNMDEELSKSLEKPEIVVKLKPLFDRPFEIMGRLYWPYYHSEEDGIRKLFLYGWGATNVSPFVSSYHPTSLLSFSDEHISWRLKPNLQMTQAKWTSRFKLGHSTSTPSVKFTRSQITIVPDLQADTLSISYNLMSGIAACLGLARVPSAIVGFLDGASRQTWSLDYSTCNADGVVSTFIPTPYSGKTFLPSLWLYLFQEYRPMDPTISLTITFEVSDLSGKLSKKLIKFQPQDSRIRWTMRTGMQPVQAEDKIMTDGVGQISKDAMRIVRQDMGKEATPTTCQIRLGPAKGMLTTPPTQDESPGLWAELRPSQVKYKDATTEEFELEVLMAPDCPSFSSIGVQFIQVLAEGGVPHQVLERLAQDSAREIASNYIKSLDNSVLAFDTVYSGSSVAQSRRSQVTKAFTPETARKRHGGDEDGDSEGFVFDAFNPYSGLPKSAAEMVVQMLSAGILPSEDPVLAYKIKSIAEWDIKQQLKGWKIPISKSALLCVTVDIEGVLKPGEVHVSFSRGFLDKQGTEFIPALNGEVLVGRSPCMAASDIQRVKAVEHPALRHRYDQIIFSRYDQQALCSLLAGGDYDGDDVLVIWDQDLVQPFRPADLKFAVPPEDDSKYLTVDKTSVQVLFDDLYSSGLDDFGKDRLLSRAMLKEMWNPSKFGLINVWWMDLAYSFGLKDARTNRACHMFCRLLDGPKQGLSISSQGFSDFRKDLGMASVKKARWQEYYKADSPSSDKETYAKLNSSHIMESLVNVSRKMESDFQKAWHSKWKSLGLVAAADTELTRRFLTHLELAKQSSEDQSQTAAARESAKHEYEDLGRIHEHVARIWEKDQLRIEQERIKSKKSTLTPADAEARVAAALWSLGDLRQSFGSTLGSEQRASELRALIASCTYGYNIDPPGSSHRSVLNSPAKLRPMTDYWEAGKSTRYRFGWTYAFRDLLDMKAAALTTRQHAPLLRSASDAAGMRSVPLATHFYLITKPDRGAIGSIRRRVEDSEQGGTESPAKKAKLA